MTTVRFKTLKIEAYNPGKSHIKRFNKVIKLSANESALGVSSKVKKVLSAKNLKLFRYPDGKSQELINQISKKFKCSKEKIICGAGSDEVIQMLCQLFIKPNDEVILPQFSFLMYRIYSRIVGAKVIFAKEKNFKISISEILKNVSKKTKIVFLANPNNPTGTYIPKKELLFFRKKLRSNILLVVDDAYFEYVKKKDYLSGLKIFTNFKNVVDSTSRKLPFGIAQIGKAFRNEITPRNFIFRVREFEQMELEFFVEPGTDEDWHEKWVEKRIEWWENQGISKENIQIIEVPKKDLSHYSKKTIDIMYKFPHGVEELEGIANRTDFDIGSHTRHQKDFQIVSKVSKNEDSVTKLAIQNKKTNDWVIPYVIEPSAGVDRGVLAVLNESYKIEKFDDGKERILLALKPHLSPIKAAVIPLKRNNDEIVKKALDIKRMLQSLKLGRVLLDNSGNIGKSYRRHDEVGTPMCITVDFQSLDDDTITVRDRDTMEQVRISWSEVPHYFEKNLL